MRIGPRRRSYVALVATGIIGYLAHWMFTSAHQVFGCSSAPSRALGLCANYQGYRPVVRWSVGTVLVVLALVVVALLARWALAPVRSLTATVSRLGPLNLGERVPVEPDADEAGSLATELNRMMDRLAAGY